MKISQVLQEKKCPFYQGKNKNELKSIIWYENIIEHGFLFITIIFPSQAPFWKEAFQSSSLLQLGF